MFLFCEVLVDEVCIYVFKFLKCLLSEGVGKDFVDYLGLVYIKVLVKLLVDLSGDEERMVVVGIISNFFISNIYMMDMFL